MATITFGGGITAIVGSHAGNTFSKNKGGAYMKQKVAGVQPRSELQLARRVVIGQLSIYYSNTLTDAQRTSWAVFASTYPTTNRVGNTINLSGQQMFCKLNSQLIDSGTGISATPPVSTAVGTPTSLTITAVSGSVGPITMVNTVASPTGSDEVWAWLSPPLSPGQSYISSQLRRMPSLQAVNFSNIVIDDYLNTFGTFPTAGGQRVIGRIQVVNTTTGIVSSFLQATAIFS